MNVLGIDTSTAASAACVVRGDGAAFEREPAPERLRERPGHASELLPAIAGCLEDAGLAWDEIDAIGVGVGPGAFTGLRVGVATARALGAAHGAELRPVSSLAALAAGARDELGEEAGERPTLAAIDARRGEVFAALHGGGGIELWEPFAAPPEAVAERLGDERIAPLAAGDGAVRFRAVLEAAGASVPPDGSRAHVVRGLSICRLATGAVPVPIEAVAPDYRRLPDATPSTA